jgi:hypothetical protein
MMEEYVYLAAYEEKSAIRLISLPSRPVSDTSLYFDLPEAFEDDSNSSVSFSILVFEMFHSIFQFFTGIETSRAADTCKGSLL